MAESLHLNYILIVSFQVHFGGAQSQNDENRVIVLIYMDLTVYVKGSFAKKKKEDIPVFIYLPKSCFCAVKGISIILALVYSC